MPDSSTRVVIWLLLLSQCCWRFHVKAKNHKSHNNHNYYRSLIELNPNYVPNKWRAAGKNYDFLDQPQSHVQEVYYSYVDPMSPEEGTLGVSYDSKNIGLFSLAKQCFELFPSLAITTSACVAIFVGWQVGQTRNFLSRWFVSSKQNVQHGRWLSMLLSAVSHSGFIHILFNLMAFLSFGPAVQRSLQSNSLQKWPLWPLLLGSALAGSIAFLCWNDIIHGYAYQGCMGLSAVTFALVTVHARMYPQAKMQMLVMGIIPVAMTAQILLTTLLGTTLVMIMASLRGNIGSNVAHAAHLGGILFGLVYYEVWVRRYGIAWKLHQLKRNFFS